MKRLLSLFITSLFLVTFCFGQSEYFSKRFIEIKTDVPFQISNNYFTLNDIFGTKDGTIVIDLKDMANSLPKSGLDFRFYTSPNVALNVNARIFAVGINPGVEISSNFRIGKDFFDFLGNGNELYEDIKVDGGANLDIFAYLKIPFAIKIKKINCVFAPSIFVPLLHGTTNDISATIKNTTDSSFKINAKADASLYSMFALSGIIGEDGKFSSEFMDSTSFSFLLSESFRNTNFGFDLSGSLGWDFKDNLTFTANYRIPIYPGKLNYETNYKCSFDYEVDASTIIGAEEETEQEQEAEYDFTDEYTDSKECKYYINRPLKLNVSADFKPFHNEYFILSGMIGCGVVHPFASNKNEIAFYPEYSLGLKASLASVVTAKFKTAYLEQVFVNQASLGLNVHVIEFNFGISTQSSRFVSALKGSGLGAFVTLQVGF